MSLRKGVLHKLVLVRRLHTANDKLSNALAAIHSKKNEILARCTSRPPFSKKKGPYLLELERDGAVQHELLELIDLAAKEGGCWLATHRGGVCAVIWSRW